MKRLNISLNEIADWDNLSLALYKAARAKRQRADIARFLAQTNDALAQLQADILAQRLPYGRFRAFTIHDPKKRLIHAACFEDRIYHHALFNLAGPVFERAMVPMSYACRVNKGVHRAINRVQSNIRRYRWFVKIDINAYFAHIDHQLLLECLSRRFKGDVLLQFKRIIRAHHPSAGMGLPIGALSSQYFANYFLDRLDRSLTECNEARAFVRYMDDIICWTDTKPMAKQMLEQIQLFLNDQLSLQIKHSAQINRSVCGVTFCGARIEAGRIRLTRRKKRRYQQGRQYWEGCFERAEINELQLQSAYAAVHAVTAQAQSQSWRRKNLQLHPPLTV